MDSDLISYYKARAKEYEQIYWRPERQADLRQTGRILMYEFKGKQVLEIACGTGFWTQLISGTAREVLAIDISQEVIDIARMKHYAPAKVRFKTIDLFDLSESDQYESLFGGFIWSHIPVQELDHFLHKVHSLVTPGGMLVFLDNHYVENSSTPILESDKQGNTYQLRKLENGRQYKVLKNFPSVEFIRQKLKNKARDIQIINLEYFWILKYRVNS
jgi:2-polyprenyl-3-methyl-5-hydroxy-6-metoxy-1,4-benzoquinol methylase